VFSHRQNRFHSIQFDFEMHPNCVISISFMICWLYITQLWLDWTNFDHESVSILIDITLYHFLFRSLWCEFLDLSLLKGWFSPSTQNQFSPFPPSPWWWMYCSHVDHDTSDKADVTAIGCLSGCLISRGHNRFICFSLIEQNQSQLIIDITWIFLPSRIDWPTDRGQHLGLNVSFNLLNGHGYFGVTDLNQRWDEKRRRFCQDLPTEIIPVMHYKQSFIIKLLEPSCHLILVTFNIIVDDLRDSR
jgi:hypothetical protein